MATLYSFDWLLYDDGRVVRSQRSHYYNEQDECDLEKIKIFVKEKILKKAYGIIRIQNVKEVRPETMMLKIIEQ